MYTEQEAADRDAFLNHLFKQMEKATETETAWRLSPEALQRGIGYGYTDFRWAYLFSENLNNLNMSGLMLRSAYLNECDLRGTELSFTTLENARLVRCNFAGANLHDTDLENADCEYAEFGNADLRDIYLIGANFRGATGLILLGPVGEHQRMIYGYTRDGETRIQAGCFNGTPAELLTAIDSKYSARSPYRMGYRDAARLIERWGKREVKRLQKLGILKTE